MYKSYSPQVATDGVTVTTETTTVIRVTRKVVSELIAKYVLDTYRIEIQPDQVYPVLTSEQDPYDGDVVHKFSHFEINQKVTS